MMLPFRTAADADAAVPRVRAHLESGGLLAYPTETVYGLGSRARTDDLRALAALKGRPPKKPFLLLVAGFRMAEDVGLVFTDAARAMAAAFWPGPLTLVLSGGEGLLPDALRGPEGGIAVRFTGHGLVARLIGALGQPLTSTSANRPGTQPAAGPEQIGDLFAQAVASEQLLVLDGGALGNPPPSTIVDCTTSIARMVREGAIPRDELRRAVGRLAP
jgi:L-threonylcarbamoyladenylate synthase